MSKINKKSINYGLKILTILAFAFIFIPFNHAAAAPTYVTGHYNPDGSYTFGDFVWGNSTSNYTETTGPTPAVISIKPKSAEMGDSAKTITITGGNFSPNSVARVNGSNRSTTFIDYSHLLVQLTANDMYQSEGFYITVFNPDSDNGYSNAAFFTINRSGYNTNTNSNNVSYNSYTNQTNNYSDNADTSYKYKVATANAVFGSNTFLPSGLVQWILLAIIILVIVILTRKIFGGEKEYHETPLKHA